MRYTHILAFSVLLLGCNQDEPVQGDSIDKILDPANAKSGQGSLLRCNPPTIEQAMKNLAALDGNWIIDSLYSPAVLIMESEINDNLRVLRTDRSASIEAIGNTLRGIKETSQIHGGIAYLAELLREFEDYTCRAEAKRVAELVLRNRPDPYTEGSGSILVSYYYLREYLGEDGVGLIRLPYNELSKPSRLQEWPRNEIGEQDGGGQPATRPESK